MPLLLTHISYFYPDFYVKDRFLIFAFKESLLTYQKNWKRAGVLVVWLCMADHTVCEWEVITGRKTCAWEMPAPQHPAILDKMSFTPSLAVCCYKRTDRFNYIIM